MEECQDVFCGIHVCSIFPGFEKAKINLMRHHDDVNGKLMFVGTDLSGDFAFSP